MGNTQLGLSTVKGKERVDRKKKNEGYNCQFLS